MAILTKGNRQPRHGPFKLEPPTLPQSLSVFMLSSLSSNREAVTIKRKDRHYNSTNISELLLNLLSSSVMTMIGLLTFPPPFEVDASTVTL